ncbi:MAG: aminodeoxychorismate synthase component I [bacterium]
MGAQKPIAVSAHLTFPPAALASQIMASSARTSAAQTRDHLLDTLARRPGSVWLDSSLSIGDRGHTSLIATDPELDVICQSNIVTLIKRDGTRRQYQCLDSLKELERIIAAHNGPAIGYISYEATLPNLGVSARRANAAVPDVRFLLYSSVVEVEGDQFDDSQRIKSHSDDRSSYRRGSVGVRPTLDRRAYLGKIATIKDHIREGDIYQANFTNRIDVETDRDPLDVYLRLRHVSPAPYSAFLNFGDYQVLSSSPERMFKRDGDNITTGPIKGTISSGNSECAATINRQRLLTSEKDRAELLMIVDLERNDLGRIARVGSVRVDSIFRPEVYSSVIHLVADVRAQLRPEIGYADIFAALLPGGSITGAPKQRAAQIIDELEVTPRSIYTGVIGYIDGNHADFSIAIRTMIHRQGSYQVHAGGGIVADSDPDAEYEEMLLKASGMLKALGVDTEEIKW